jgi:hypothetical protein
MANNLAAHWPAMSVLKSTIFMLGLPAIGYT